MLSDPISDLLCRLRNAARAQHPDVVMPHSKMKESIAHVLKREGYLSEVSVEDSPKKQLRVLEGLRRMSSPGRRVYARSTEIPKIRGGLGVVVLSTSSGIVTDREARKRNLGGELLCSVW
jgi:small subunit ribosomal protein S8